MTTLSPTRLFSRLALAVCVAGGSLAMTTPDADARFGKKAGWNKRSTAAKSEKRSDQKKVNWPARSTTSRVRVSQPAPAPVAKPTPAADQSARKGLLARIAAKREARRAAEPTVSTVQVRLAARPEPARVRSTPVAFTVPSAPKPKPKPASTKPTRTNKRAGLLARLFTPEELPAPAPARTRPAPPKKPQLAPGQPNANQSAPKINHTLIANSSKSQSSVTINIARQRAYVYIGGQVAVDTPVSTARTGKYTPRGTFRVGERVHTGKISTIYDVEMPRWMRLGSSAYGMHAGYLPGYPASAGCIRMPFSAADAVYKATGYGTRVKIISG